ncbi:TrbG/VirB9 family P-type conjugative transfer protein, partial [Synergistaceae bacterium OttesenSCG-928-I11]|nr:TrbG/VirB9 family P-type conjugative transfer protein [Synergistaceae bacterium OttesenSCG-928-I11]
MKRILRKPVFLLVVAICMFVVPAIGTAKEYKVGDEVRPDPQWAEIEYGGRIISFDLNEAILAVDGYDHADLDGYKDQWQSTVPYGDGQTQGQGGPSMQQITKREYEEEQRARKWLEIKEDLTLRDIDNRALDLVKEFSQAKGAVPPSLGQAGSVVITFSSYIPKLVCRPMYVTDIMLQPGESVTGVHPGDPVRWQFVPSKSGAGDMEQVHVLVKPLVADISTNLIINTDRRT